MATATTTQTTTTSSTSGGSTSPNKLKPSIHNIRELQLETISIEDNYDVIKEIGSGDYGKVILGVHRATRHQVALKAVPKATTTLKDFLTEFHYSYFLSPHPSILDTYDVAFETTEHYWFAQEVAHLGDLWNYVEKTAGAGLEEKDVKIICEQVGSALDFMHQKDLVHRDVRAENILIFSPDFTKVKLTDFGLTRRAGTLVTKRTRSLPTCPPEIWEAVKLERYTVELGSDCWQMGMLIFATLTARFPWERADIVDPRFREFIEWQKRKTVKTPKEFRRFTPRLMRLFRRWMEQKPTKRYPITEINKYLKDRWLMRGSPRASSVIKLNVPEVDYNGGSLGPPLGAGVTRSQSCSFLNTQQIVSQPTNFTATQQPRATPWLDAPNSVVAPPIIVPPGVPVTSVPVSVPVTGRGVTPAYVAAVPTAVPGQVPVSVPAGSPPEITPRHRRRQTIYHSHPRTAQDEIDV